MSRSTSEWYRRPELIFADMVDRASRGDGPGRHYHRAVVLAVDHEGALLENPNGSGKLTAVDRSGRSQGFPATVGPENPRGSIRARVLTDGLDRLRDDETLRTFWPMFPPDQVGIPVAPGEHVYVIFEGGLEHGVWISRVPGHDSANAFAGVDSYTQPHAPKSAVDSFTPNEPQYQKTDDHAGLAPQVGSTDFFKGG